MPESSSPLRLPLERLIVMGVSGCGKSTLAHAIADHLRWSMIEGDQYHSETSREKMSHGVPLTDEDRATWLNTLARLMADARAPTVMTCSALKASYRDTLRAHSRQRLGFVYMKLTQEASFQRVSQRKNHPFPASLVASQFAALESPSGEPDVLTLDANDTTDTQVAAVRHWLQTL